MNKGDANNPEIRCRLVAQEINWNKMNEWFVAAPPLEALRLIISIAATHNYDIMTNDVSRAYFYAPVKEGQYIYVKLPEEDILPGEEGMCGKAKL